MKTMKKIVFILGLLAFFNMPVVANAEEGNLTNVSEEAMMEELENRFKEEGNEKELTENKGEEISEGSVNEQELAQFKEKVAQYNLERLRDLSDIYEIKGISTETEREKVEILSEALEEQESLATVTGYLALGLVVLLILFAFFALSR